MSRTKQIEQTDKKDSSGRKFFRMRHTKILESGESADRSSYEIISNEKKRADNRNDFATMPHAGVNAPTIRIKAADHHVVEADQSGQNTHGGDQPKRSVATHREGKADDVGFARPPIAIEDRRCPRNIHVARPLYTGCDH